MPAAIAATPAERPSMLSSMLNALMRATIHSTERASGNEWIGNERRQPQVRHEPHAGGRDGELHEQPKLPRQPAAIVGQAQQHQHGPGGEQDPQFACLGRCSGKMLASQIRAQGSPRCRFASNTTSTSCATANVATTPSQTANPPPRGVGVVCTFRSLGRSIKPQRAAFARGRYMVATSASDEARQTDPRDEEQE